MNNLKNINNLFSIIFSLLFIFGVYKIVNDFNSIIDNISKISVSILFFSTLVYFTSVILRYFRWKIIYKELFDQYKFNMLNETIIGYMANNIFPFILEVASKNQSFLKIFGSNWPTKDGTGVRDYIHVMDLAEGHLVALEHLFKNKPKMISLNIGSGEGTSVLDLVKSFEKFWTMLTLSTANANNQKSKI